MRKKKYYIKLLIIVLGVVADLVTKIIFAGIFATPREDVTVIDNFFYFTYLENTGAAYGMFSGGVVPLAIFSSLFIIGFVIYDYFYHEDNWIYILGMSFIVSGAIGNLIDRVFLGYVRDFISIRLFSFVFNIADLWVTIGVILFAINILLSIIKEAKKGKSQDGSK